MLNGKKIRIDGCCEIKRLLRPWTHDEFYDFGAEPILDDSVYIVGRVQLNDNREKVRAIIEKGGSNVIFANPHEGSETLRNQLRRIDLDAIARDGRLPIITGGDLEGCYHYLLYDHFLPLIHDYEENLSCISRTDEIYLKTQKPYKFLFLNGRARPHRRYLLERLEEMGLLQQSLWTWLDTSRTGNRHYRLERDGRDLLDTHRAIRLLPQHYEVSAYDVSAPITNSFAKQELFRGDWGEIYLKAEPYIDSYFSLVTETVFDYPGSFRTEKIWKPIAMGHPWIAVANAGYYRDLRNLGFRTFDHLIDERFDAITDHVTRLERIIQVVDDLCRQDAEQFLLAARDVCKYNQQHLAHMSPKVREEFPGRFFKWMT